MATVMQNTALSKDFYLLRAEQANTVRMGQFYMARCWDSYPVLSRPISVFDADAEHGRISLLYRVVGEGTELLSRLQPGDSVTLDGPYGNGFPARSGREAPGRFALVGGGVGIAPLYLTAKTLREQGAAVDLYLGFSDEALLTEEYDAVCDAMTVDVGGYITDRIDPARYDAVYTCGPDAMMRALAGKCRATGIPLWVSMENRMACGLGACLVCSCKTENGNRKVCKDGPVFPAEEVYFGE